MKLNKTMIAVALGLSVASLSRAETIYLTGSTAMRATIYSVLTNGGAVFQTPPVFTGYSGGAGPSASSDTYMGFAGTLVGGSGTTVINCYWSGSEDGILHVASNNIVNQTFMSDSLIATSGSGSDSGGLPPTTETEPAELAMADNAQSFSRTLTPALNGTQVGVITFEYVRNAGLWTGSNVTTSQFLQAMSGGAKRAVFDGNALHTNDYVYVSGRDTSSGTRVNELGETGYGILTPVNQIELSGGAMQILSLSTNRSGGITTNYIGNFGYSSGGTLAGSFTGTTVGATDYVHTNSNVTGGFSTFAMFSISDGNTAVGDGGTVLSYNGVPFASTNVTEGTYDCWGNEYIYEANNVDSTANAVFGLISTNTAPFCDGVKAIALTAMHSTRQGPITPPAHN